MTPHVLTYDDGYNEGAADQGHWTRVAEAERDAARADAALQKAAHEALVEYHRSVVCGHAVSVQTANFERYRAANEALATASTMRVADPDEGSST